MFMRESDFQSEKGQTGSLLIEQPPLKSRCLTIRLHGENKTKHCSPRMFFVKGYPFC